MQASATPIVASTPVPHLSHRVGDRRPKSIRFQIDPSPPKSARRPLATAANAIPLRDRQSRKLLPLPRVVVPAATDIRAGPKTA